MTLCSELDCRARVEPKTALALPALGGMQLGAGKKEAYLHSSGARDRKRKLATTPKPASAACRKGHLIERIQKYLRLCENSGFGFFQCFSLLCIDLFVIQLNERGHGFG